MNPIQFYKRWKKGMNNLTVAQQLQGKIAGLYGNIVGLCCGVFSFSIYMFVAKDFKWWWSMIVIISGIYLSYIDLVGTKQQYKQACEIQDMINNSKVKT